MMQLLFLLSFACSCFGIDPETLPYSRTQEYGMEPYHHIVIYSAPRTGSSLIYNVFRYLFEKNSTLHCPHTPFDLGGVVRKTHDRKNVKALGKKGVLYVVPIRHPIDASISRYRTQKNSPQDLQKWCKRQIAKQAKFLKKVEALQREGFQILMIKYEEAADNFDLLLQKVEHHFSLLIEESDKESMKKGLSKENLQAHLTSLADFHNSYPLSGFHGEHIRPRNYTPPPELLHWLHHYLQKEKGTFQRYGYIPNKSEP